MGVEELAHLVTWEKGTTVTFFFPSVCQLYEIYEYHIGNEERAGGGCKKFQ